MEKKLINPSEVEIKLSFTNYKLLKREEFNLKGSHIYFVKGPNEVGKTSMLNALKAAHEMKDDTPQKVTSGEIEGMNVFTIPGPDGNMYTVIYEFTDSTTKFVVFDADGNKISKITDMRNIFKYNDVDTDTFVAWSRTAEGRRKQKELILELLPADDYMKYKDLETEEGELFANRTVTNKSVERVNNLINEYKLTADEITIVGNQARAEKAVGDKIEELVALQSSEEKRDVLIGKISTVNSMINTVNKGNIDVIKFKQGSIIYAEDDIVELKRQINELQTKIDKATKQITILKSDIDTRMNDDLITVDAYKNDLDMLRNELKEIPEMTDKLEYAAKIDKLNTTIANGNKYIDTAKQLEVKKTNYDNALESLEKIQSESSVLTDDITKLRGQKETIITKAEFPVDNVSFNEDGYLTIDGFVFDEKQTCESDNILMVAQLLCKMNVTPIQILGDAALLDYDKLDKLYDIAEANGKIMFLDEVDRDLDKIAVVAYEKHDKTIKAKAPKKKLSKDPLPFENQ